MDTTHTWHPGAVRVKVVWPVPVPLLPDEILSSWIVRTALAHGCDPLVLTGNIWPGWRVWTCDVDRQVSSPRMIELSRRSGMSVSALQLATLNSIVTRIIGTTPPIRQLWPWITTIGARNRLRNGGMQYCPLCLASDIQPYFRLQWRFAWHTGCQTHGCRLVDCCPRCGAPVEYHRVVPEHSPIAICPSCHGDLREGTQSCLSDPAARAFQMTADQAILSGNARIGDQILSVSMWMDVAHFYVAMLRRFKRSHSRTIDSFLKNSGIALAPANSSSSSILEIETVEERTRVLAAVSQLMAISLLEIAKLMEVNDMSRQAVCPKGIRMPEVVSDAIQRLKDATRSGRRTRKQECQTNFPRSRLDVERMMRRLRVRIARRSR